MAINATQVLIKLDTVLLIGQTATGLSEATTMIDVSNKLSGKFSEFIPGRTSGTVSVSGLASEKAETTLKGYYELREARDNGTAVEILIGSFTDTTGATGVEGTKTISYSAYISQLDVDFPDNEKGTFDCTFQLTGAPTEAVVTP